MIHTPGVRYGVVLGGILGLTLGPAGVVAGMLCGALLDSVLSEARIRRAVRGCLDGSAGVSGASGRTERPASRRWIRGGQLLRGANRVREHNRNRIVSYVGGVECIRLAAVSLRIHRPVAIKEAEELPADRIERITAYLESVFDLSPRIATQLLRAVHTESLSYSLEQLLEGLCSYASDGRVGAHIAFLDSLLPVGSAGVRTQAGRAAEEAAESAGLLWERNASAVLGLNGPASLPEVRAAFRRLAREHHPDQSGSETEAFIRIREAYETLLTRSSVLSEGQAHEDVRKDPRSRAQSDTHC